MDEFHLADREPVAKAIEAAAGCSTLEELHEAIRNYAGHDLATNGHFTPSWPARTPDSDPRGPLMIVAEYPEPEDAEQGRPFTGAYGAVMREVLGWYGLDLDRVHVAYAVHWAPEGEKSLNATQISASRPFLFKEIELVRPRAMLAMGRGVLEALLMYRKQLTPILGMTMNWKRGDLVIPAYATWHPAWPNRFKTSTGDFGFQIEGFLERFGLPDGGVVKPRFGQAA